MADSMEALDMRFPKPSVDLAETTGGLEKAFHARYQLRKPLESDCPMDEEVFAFGSFRLIPAQRMLSENGKPLRLGSRAFDILVALTERAGETIPKEQLIARAWPETVVEEATLRVHVAALRKALGDGRGGKRYITNVAGRGYTFIAPVARENALAATAGPNGMAETGNLPALLMRVVGRDNVISVLTTQLARRRFLTIVGPGGIGKTTVAVAVAERVRASYKDGAWFVGLAPLSDPDLVPSAVGTTLGVAPSGGDHTRALAAWLRDRNALLVLDNCEHVIGAAAALAEALLRAAPHAGILATAREPLRAEGERLHRLAPLELPPQEKTSSTADEALGYSAVELFNERATATTDSFLLDDANVPAVLEICRRLDGVPLALELAAARVDTLGVDGLAARLDDRFGVLRSGRRTALPRQQTLRAAMDWSYELLPEAEQVVLRRLAVFRGSFTTAAAVAIVIDERIVAGDAIEGIANLAGKSLITTDIADNNPHHRLLDTTRAYAIEKLGESGERGAVAYRHAFYYRDLLERAEGEATARSADESLADYAREIDNLRAALDWAFSPDGDATIGVALTIASERLWFGLSLMDECRTRVKRALATTESGAGGGRRQQMQLYAILGAALYYTKGPSPEECAAWTNALELAERLDDIEYRLRALWGLWRYRMGNAEYRPALTLAQRFSSLLPNQADKTDVFAGERMLGFSLFCLGDLSNARNHFEHVLGSYPASPPQSQTGIGRFQLDVAATVRATLAQVLWLQGFPDQAMRMAEENVVNTRHVLSLCNALDGACAVALAMRDLTKARRYVGLLLEHSAKLTRGLYRAFGHLFEGQLLIQCGDVAAGSQRLRVALDELADAGIVMRRAMGLGMLAEALAAVGRVTEGLVVVDEALTQCEYADSRWNLSELLRIKGDLIVLDDSRNGTVSAGDLYQQGVDWARRQGALSWELRAATSLVRLLRDRDRLGEARDLLAPIYERFTEGFDTADLREAKALLEELAA
jgi:predicted ATPase/DNA-binding winged helix-turn-helix (wHTH) protein